MKDINEKEMDNKIIFKNTTIENEKLRNFLHKIGLKETQVETIYLLLKVSSGSAYLKTTIEELTTNFYPDYLKIKKVNIKKSKNFKSRVRCRLDYFVNEWERKNKKRLFEITSKKCSGYCSTKHTKKCPNPDIITIKLNFLIDLFS